MAEKDNAIMTTTQLHSFVKWGANGTFKAQRFIVSMFNDMYTFKIQTQKDSNKFDGDSITVAFSNLNEAVIVNVLKEIMQRLRDIHDNKKVEKKSLVIINRDSIKEATSKLEFNCYTNENTEKGGIFSGYIKVGKKDSPDDDKWKEITMWFETGRTIYRNSEVKPVEDLKIYNNLMNLLYKFEACLAKSSTARDAHLKKHFAALYGDNTKSEQSNQNGKSSPVNDDDDDFPF